MLFLLVKYYSNVTIFGTMHSVRIYVCNPRSTLPNYSQLVLGHELSSAVGNWWRYNTNNAYTNYANYVDLINLCSFLFFLSFQVSPQTKMCCCCSTYLFALLIINELSVKLFFRLFVQLCPLFSLQAFFVLIFTPPPPAPTQH